MKVMSFANECLVNFRLKKVGSTLVQCAAHAYD